MQPEGDEADAKRTDAQGPDPEPVAGPPAEGTDRPPESPIDDCQVNAGPLHDGDGRPPAGAAFSPPDDGRSPPDDDPVAGQAPAGDHDPGAASGQPEVPEGPSPRPARARRPKLTAKSVRKGEKQATVIRKRYGLDRVYPPDAAERLVRLNLEAFIDVMPRPEGPTNHGYDSEHLSDDVHAPGHKRSALLLSIEESGEVLTPIEADEDDNLLHGFRRILIAKAMGIVKEVPLVILTGWRGDPQQREEQKRAYIREVNLTGRHLSLAEKKKLARRLLGEDERRFKSAEVKLRQTYALIAAQTGLGQRTVENEERDHHYLRFRARCEGEQRLRGDGNPRGTSPIPPEKRLMEEDAWRRGFGPDASKKRSVAGLDEAAKERRKLLGELPEGDERLEQEALLSDALAVLKPTMERLEVERAEAKAKKEAEEERRRKAREQREAEAREREAEERRQAEATLKDRRETGSKGAAVALAGREGGAAAEPSNRHESEDDVDVGRERDWEAEAKAKAESERQFFTDVTQDDLGRLLEWNAREGDPRGYALVAWLYYAELLEIDDHGVVSDFTLDREQLCSRLGARLADLLGRHGVTQELAKESLESLLREAEWDPATPEEGQVEAASEPVVADIAAEEGEAEDATEAVAAEQGQVEPGAVTSTELVAAVIAPEESAAVAPGKGQVEASIEPVAAAIAPGEAEPEAGPTPEAVGASLTSEPAAAPKPRSRAAAKRAEPS